MTKSLFYSVFILLFFLSVGLLTSAQKNMFGINAIALRVSENSFDVVSGPSYQRELTNKSSFETGMYFSNQKNYDLLQLPNRPAVLVGVRRYYLTIPALYKWRTNVINISSGITLNKLIAWKQITSKSQSTVQSVKESPFVSVGYLFKIGKSIELKNNFLIEPEIIAGDYESFSSIKFGAGVGIKYFLRKKMTL